MNVEIPVCTPRAGQRNRCPTEYQKRKYVEAVVIHGLSVAEVAKRSTVQAQNIYKYIEALEYEIRLSSVETDVAQLKQPTVPIILPPHIHAFINHDDAIEEASGNTVYSGPHFHKESGMWLLMDFQQGYDYEMSRAY